MENTKYTTEEAVRAHFSERAQAVIFDDNLVVVDYEDGENESIYTHEANARTYTSTARFINAIEAVIDNTGYGPSDFYGNFVAADITEMRIADACAVVGYVSPAVTTYADVDAAHAELDALQN